MRRISVNGLAMITIIGLLIFAGHSIGAAQSDPPEIMHANANIWSVGSVSEQFYGVELHIEAIGSLGDLQPSDINLSVNGGDLTIENINEVTQNAELFQIRASGSAEGKYLLGEYEIIVKDNTGQSSAPYIIGVLLDVPEDLPELIFPHHEQMIYEREPLFEWEAFLSEYNGQLVDPWGYEVNLEFPDNSMFTVWPIPGNQTTLEFYNPNWDPSQPPSLSPGVYGITLHSLHNVAPNFSFEHHRVIQFEVLDYLPISIDIKPGSDPNSINLGSRGVVGLAALTTEDFDASTVDPVTVLFAGASPLRWSWEDVDYDGDIDLLFKFKILELDLNESSSEAMLTGMTFDETPVLGTDTIQVVP